MQMIFEKISGGQGGEETLKMVYDELREDGLPVSKRSGGRNRTARTVTISLPPWRVCWTTGMKLTA